MRKRLAIAAVCILALPLLFAPSQIENLTSPAAFSTVAVAGHGVMGGGWCDCGAPGCICDPGEQPGGNSRATPSDKPSDGKGVNQGAAPGVDLASGLLTLALAFLFLLRMR